MGTVSTVCSRALMLSQYGMWPVGHSWDSWIFTRPLSCCRVLLQLETNCSMCLTLEAYSLTSVVLPHSNDPLLGSIVEVSHQTLPVGRPFHVVIFLCFILLCCLCQWCQSCRFKLLLLGTLLLDQHLVVGQDVLHEVVATTESIFILDSCFQVDAVVVCILHQFQTHSWFHVG